MESLGIWGDNMTHHALHWDGYGVDHQVQGFTHIELTPTEDNFHVYALYWAPGLVQFYVDDVMTAEWRNPRVGWIDSFLRLSLQVGGWSGNSQVDDAALPAGMLVDYVRVWSGTAD